MAAPGRRRGLSPTSVGFGSSRDQQRRPSVTGLCSQPLRPSFAGSLFCPWSASWNHGPPPDGIRRAIRLANLTTRGREPRSALGSCLVHRPDARRTLREGRCFEPPVNLVFLLPRCRRDGQSHLTGAERRSVDPHPMRDHGELLRQLHFHLLQAVAPGELALAPITIVPRRRKYVERMAKLRVERELSKNFTFAAYTLFATYN